MSLLIIGNNNIVQNMYKLLNVPPISRWHIFLLVFQCLKIMLMALKHISKVLYK